LILSFALVASFVAQPFAQELRYPVEDFHNRTIELPLDYGISDYRIGAELGRYFPNYQLFIADDNHTMSIHTECYPPLRNAFLRYGLDSVELRSALQSSDCREWPGD